MGSFVTAYFSRGIEFPLPKKKIDNTKKGRILITNKVRSTPTASSTPTNRGGRRSTPVIGQKRAKGEDSRATSVDADGELEDDKENNNIVELGTEEEDGQIVEVKNGDDEPHDNVLQKERD